VGGIIAQGNPLIHFADNVRKRTAAWDNEHGDVPAGRRDFSENRIQIRDATQHAPTHLDHDDNAQDAIFPEHSVLEKGLCL
jgi:hypothetical protein